MKFVKICILFVTLLGMSRCIVFAEDGKVQRLYFAGKSLKPLFFSGGGRAFYPTCKTAYSAGSKVIAPTVYVPWIKPGESKANYHMINYHMSRLTKNYPDAKFLIKLGHIDPPKWWRKAHPGELLKWEDGKTDRYISVASKIWKADIEKNLTRTVKYLEKHWGKRIIGYFHGAQNEGEWYYPIWFNMQSGDMHFSEPFRKSYQLFLHKKYKNIDALNKAFGSQYRSLEDIKVPSGKARRKALLGVFRNPARQKELFDFTLFKQQILGDTIIQISAIVKKASHGKPVFVFAAYLLELSGSRYGAAHAGALQLNRLLNTDYVDGLISIISYKSRKQNEPGCIMVPAESIISHGKVMLIEDDTRTHLSNPKLSEGSRGRPETANGTYSILERNLSRAMVHNSYVWLFDLFGRGWFNSPEIWQRLRSLEDAFLKAHKQLAILKSDVAVIVHEKSLLALKPGIELSKPLLADQRVTIATSGIGCPSWWLLNDLIDGKIPPHKLTVMLNAFHLSANERQKIRTYFEKNGGTVLWLYAPGYLTDNGPSLKAMQELTGMKFKSIFKNIPTSLKIVNSKFSTSQNLSKITLKIPRITPVFGVVPSKRTCIIGKFNNNSNIGGAALQDNGKFKSVFVAAPLLTSGVFAGIAKQAGVHIYAPAGNTIIADNKFLGILSSKSGNLKVFLPNAKRLKTRSGKYLSDKPQKTYKLNLNKNIYEYYIMED